MALPTAKCNGRNPKPAALLPQHLADLRKSGLSDATIAACGFRSVYNKEAGEILGKPWRRGTCLAIPYFAADGTAQTEQDRAAIGGDKLAYTEPEAARMLSLHPHQLRDERLRGRVQASVGPGRTVLYSRQDLLDYLAARRWEGGQ
jgi:hypothetical protein